MPRTPEQREADEALTAALESVWAAYAGIDDEDPGILTDYLVIGVRRGYDDEGDSWSHVCCFTRDSAVPDYVQLGLIEQMRARLVQPDFVVVDDEE